MWGVRQRDRPVEGHTSPQLGMAFWRSEPDSPVAMGHPTRRPARVSSLAMAVPKSVS